MRLPIGRLADAQTEWSQICEGAKFARGKVSASKCMRAMGSNFATAEAIARLPEVVELNIGHFLDRRGGL